MTTYSWVLPVPMPEAASVAFEGVSRPVAQTLYSRGFRSIEEARTFFAPGESRVSDPFHLQGMDGAVRRVAEAIENGERIVVYGDYDADGVTASALMVMALSVAGGSVEHYIPNRFDEGYGLNRDAIQAISDRGGRVLLTVDCGVRSVDEVAWANALGLDVILTDHHHPGPELPPALSIVNPNQPGDESPFRGLSGVGLAYKLAKALESRAKGLRADDYLDLVALGTVADVSPLVDENRFLVSAGLDQMRQKPRAGIEALLRVARLNQAELRAVDIAFGLAPRINAAGRLDSAETAFELLVAESPEVANGLAQALEAANRKRQGLTRAMVESARVAGPWAADRSRVIFAIDPMFNEGVVGLAASRLAEEFLRPALIARQDAGLIKGSARSIPGFHITEALQECADLLVRFGGHAAAAGFVLREENLDALLTRLSDVVETMGLPLPEKPSMTVDAEVNVSELNDSLLTELDRFEPTGEGNQQPVFLVRGVQVIEARAVGASGAHLKMTLAGDRRLIEAIAFRQGDQLSTLSKSVDVIFHFERNEYRGRVTPQMNVLDLRPAETA